MTDSAAGDYPEGMLNSLTRNLPAAALVAATSVFALGCDGGDDDVDAAADNISEAAGDYEEAAEEYGDEAKDELDDAQEELSKAAEEMRQASDVDLSTLSGAELAEQVRLRLDDVKNAIDNGDLAAAEGSMNEVAAVAGQLPEPVAQQIAEVRGLLDKAQSAEESAAQVRDLSGDLQSE